MMEEQNSAAEKHLPELPFTYVRTEDPGKADYSITRHLKIRISEGEFPPPLTDEQILMVAYFYDLELLKRISPP